MSHLLCESLEVLDDGGLRQLMENVPVEIGTGLEGERFGDVVRGVSGNRTSTSPKDVVHDSGKRKTKSSETETKCVLRPKIVAFEIGDGSDEESLGFRNEIERANPGNSCLSSDCADRTLTEFGLSELELMARAKAQEMGPESHVVSSNGLVRVPTIGSPGGPPDANAVRTKYYPGQFAKSFLKDFFEHNPPTHSDATHKKTSFSADQIIEFARAVGLEVSLASFGMLEDLLLKTNLIGRGGGGGRGKASSRSAFSSCTGTSVGDSVASRSVYWLPTITETTETEQLALGFQEPFSSRQVDKALSNVAVVRDESGTDSLKNLKEIKTEIVRKASKLFRWSTKAVQILLQSAEKRVVASYLRRRCWQLNLL